MEVKVESKFKYMTCALASWTQHKKYRYFKPL